MNAYDTWNADSELYFHFESKGFPGDTFQVVGFEGEEEISRPYWFDIELISYDPAIDMEKMITSPAYLEIGTNEGSRKIHGIISEFEQYDRDDNQWHRYHAVLVPRLWLLCLSRQNQIYQNKAVLEIIDEELRGDRHKGDPSMAVTDDFEMRLFREYPKREYVVQYDETDLNFISRLMEHEGIFYFFEHDDDKEKLIVADRNLYCPPILSGDDYSAGQPRSHVPYLPVTGMESVVSGVVQRLSCRHKRLPKKVMLRDYNYRLLPTITKLEASADIDKNGHGLVSEYGAHFKNRAEGDALAGVRSEALLCRKHIQEGIGTCVYFSAAHSYELYDHFRDDFNRKYLITRVKHSAGRKPAKEVKDDLQAPLYRNTFYTIPFDVSFRPERISPKPRIRGVLNARVDAALLTNRAEIDNEGRYKVVMPFDLSGPEKGSGSRFIRMAQPYGGKQQGMHFPIHPGSEVLCTFVNGDPDRPIITGVVPNPENPSPVTSSNSTRNVIRTASGCLMEFNDGKG